QAAGLLSVQRRDLRVAERAVVEDDLVELALEELAAVVAALRGADRGRARAVDGHGGEVLGRRQSTLAVELDPGSAPLARRRRDRADHVHPAVEWKVVGVPEDAEAAAVGVLELRRVPGRDVELGREVLADEPLLAAAERRGPHPDGHRDARARHPD